MPYRLYKPGDFPALYAVEELCFAPPFRFSRRTMRPLIQHPNPPPGSRKRVGKWRALPSSGWGMRGSGTPRGRSTPPESRGGVAAYIETIEVAPEARGRGVGGELLARIEGSASAAGAEGIWLHVEAGNAAAIRLYEAHGYACQGRRENFYPEGRAALIYRKRLNSGAATEGGLTSATPNAAAGDSH